MDVRFHFIRDLFRTRKPSVECVASTEQHADILLEYRDVPMFTISSSKIRNAVRWLKLLEDTGIRE